MTGSPLVSGTPEGRSDDEIRALCQAATPGPWFAAGPPWNTSTPFVMAGSPDPHFGVFVCDLDDPSSDDERPSDVPDAEFIAAARSLVPSLLARVEAAEADNAELRAENEALRASLREQDDATPSARRSADYWLRQTQKAEADLAAAVANLRAVEAALGRDRFGHIAKSRIRAALADPVGPQDERPARPQLHPLAKRERGTVALDGSAGPPGFGPVADPVGLPTERRTDDEAATRGPEMNGLICDNCGVALALDHHGREASSGEDAAWIKVIAGGEEVDACTRSCAAELLSDDGPLRPFLDAHLAVITEIANAIRGDDTDDERPNR